MIWNWLLAHLACGLAAGLLACAMADYHVPTRRE